MKTLEKTTAQMDDIVFEHRNKSYGAYILRKMYNKQLNKALLLSTAILIAGLAYPIVSSYNLHGSGRPIDEGTTTTIMQTPPKEKIQELPKLPEQEKVKQIVFTRPDVIAGEVPEEDGLLAMDDINSRSKNVIIDISPETPDQNHPVIIEEPMDKQETLTIVEEMPSFAGGETERRKFLAENITYPTLAVENGIQGTVYVQFIIDSKGNITDVEVMRGIGGGCDEEALRVVKAMPMWHPGKQNGRKVRVKFTMPIIFKLQG